MAKRHSPALGAHRRRDPARALAALARRGQGPARRQGHDHARRGDADLSHAKVLVTDLAGRDHAGDTVAALSRTAGFLRSELARRLSLYTVPQLAFVYDDSIESGLELSQLIDKAVAEDRKRGS
jgi:ribosome-binding factor A